MTLHAAIVGGGYSGTLQAIHLISRGATVTLIERTERLARGVAYSTRHSDHLLNVRAAGMSAFPDQPDHFADWLAKRGSAAAFAERRLYGTYLEELLAAAASEASGRLQIVKGEAVDVLRQGDSEQVLLSNGSSVNADAVILSVGNLAPEVPRSISPELRSGQSYVADPWVGDIAAGLAPEDTVLLIGTGLTAIDAALMLDAAGFGGRILALSRRGLVPKAHERHPEPVPELDEEPAARCTALLRFVRAEAERLGWRPAVDQLRPVTQKLWTAASATERRRFLRHLRPWWDIHRHRIAPEIADRIARMEQEGRLRFAAGKILSASPDDERASVAWRPRGSNAHERLTVARIVNCTGPQGDIARAGEPLLSNLLAAGRIRPDPCRIGIDVDRDGRTIDASGHASATLLAIGPMTRSAFWEIVAVPDLRVQTYEMAQRLAA